MKDAIDNAIASRARRVSVIAQIAESEVARESPLAAMLLRFNPEFLLCFSEDGQIGDFGK
jgi:hypothetical protein